MELSRTSFPSFHRTLLYHKGMWATLYPLILIIRIFLKYVAK